jgi:PAS domain S-box-containing protein
MTDVEKQGALEWKLNLAIVGGGRGAESFLRMIASNRFKQFNFHIMGIAEVNLDAPGVEYAREIGVPLITTDYKELFDLKNLDLIIELTGRDDVCKRLELERPRRVKLIDSFSANLFWELLTAEEVIIQQRTKMRRQVEAERKWINQILDSIPDEIMVIGVEGEAQYANAALLNNNDISINEVLGKNCYDVEMRRGDCSLGIGDCPLGEVLKSRKSVNTIRKRYDEKGAAHYASIVAAPMFDESRQIVGIIESTRDITHRITLEEVLKATESRLRQFMEFAPIATYVKSPEGIYREVNDLACETFGKSPQEILGKTDLEIFERGTAEIFRASDAEVLKTKKKITSEKQVSLMNRTISLSTIKYPILDPSSQEVLAICGLVNDVTELRETERELLDTRDYLRNILNNSPVIIMTTDLSGRIVSFNTGAEESLGYPKEEAVGTFAKGLYIDPEERDTLLRRVIHEGAVRDYETNLVCKDGQYLPVSITLSQLKNAAGEMIGTVGMSKDISHRKVLFEQITQSERLAAVGRLASGVAHEINNPLAVISEISGFLNELLKRDPKLENPEFLSEFAVGLPKINKEVTRCRSITSRMLSFARKTTVTEETTDVNAALDEILPFWEKKANLRNVSIHRDYDPDLPKVRIEEMQLQEIFINIINNAVQAIEGTPGGKIIIRTTQDEGKVKVSIKDNGPGIAQEVMDRIFDPFVTTKEAGKGTGLGLSICYGIIKRYDGEITVNSKSGEGAEFIVTLAPR